MNTAEKGGGSRASDSRGWRVVSKKHLLMHVFYSHNYKITCIVTLFTGFFSGSLQISVIDFTHFLFTDLYFHRDFHRCFLRNFLKNCS